MVGSLLNKTDRDNAALEVSKGRIVGIFNRGVCALWFDGGNSKAVSKMKKIKGRGSKAIALTLSLDEFIPMIDTSKLPKATRDFLSLPDLKSRIGSLLFIRAPLKKDYLNLVPKHAKSIEGEICMIQNWDSHGHIPIERFLEKLKSLGVLYPGVTSMNESNKPEIVDQGEAQKFCEDHDIPIFLKDPKAHPLHKGSYTIITLNQNGIKLSRDGNIPGFIIEQILGTPISRDEAKQSHYPQLKFPENLLAGLTPKETRKKVLQYLR